MMIDVKLDDLKNLENILSSQLYEKNGMGNSFLFSEHYYVKNHENTRF